MISEREQDLRDEYLADAAWEARQEERHRNCEHENWSITDEGIVDVEHWKYGSNGATKLDEPIACIEIECDDCGRTNYLRVPYKVILELLRGLPWHDDDDFRVHVIDEDGWGE